MWLAGVGPTSSSTVYLACLERSARLGGMAFASGAILALTVVVAGTSEVACLVVLLFAADDAVALANRLFATLASISLLAAGACDSVGVSGSSAGRRGLLVLASAVTPLGARATLPVEAEACGSFVRAVIGARRTCGSDTAHDSTASVLLGVAVAFWLIERVALVVPLLNGAGRVTVARDGARLALTFIAVACSADAGCRVRRVGRRDTDGPSRVPILDDIVAGGKPLSDAGGDGADVTTTPGSSSSSSSSSS